MELQKPKRKPTTQEQIIRQSCLKAAAEISIARNSTFTIDVLKLAEELEVWVHREL